MRLEWDPAKNEINKAKHDLSFEEASELFTQPVDFLVLYDETSADLEERFISVGPIASGIVVVVWVEREDDVVRLISARRATKSEIGLYRRYTRGGA